MADALNRPMNESNQLLCVRLGDQEFALNIQAIREIRAGFPPPPSRNHVWSYDFVEDGTHDGRKLRMLNVVDEFTREALAIRVARRLNSNDVIDVLSN